ncbi:MAG: hypothetical protein H6R19_2506 [Proteobacteria bacterium]|nr:hypothetical protein [Pseudomonadota bacterium]
MSRCAWGGCLLLNSLAWAEEAPEPGVAREYKLQLDTQVDLERLAARLQTVLPAHGATVNGHFKVRKHRDVVFFDSPASCVLRRAGWILRARGDAGRKRELTLKLRGDAGLPEDAALRSTRDVAFKQEEDVSPPATVVPSYSWSRQSRHAILSLQDARALFPVLQAVDLGPAQALQPVAGLAIREQTYVLLRLSFAGQDYPLEASVWQRPDAQPLLVELSFRFDNSWAGRQEALRIFAVLQTQAGVLPAAQSKTEALYQVDGNFCRR